MSFSITMYLNFNSSFFLLLVHQPCLTNLFLRQFGCVFGECGIGSWATDLMRELGQTDIALITGGDMECVLFSSLSL